jgi:hypothetical protein
MAVRFGVGAAELESPGKGEGGELSGEGVQPAARGYFPFAALRIRRTSIRMNPTSTMNITA